MSISKSTNWTLAWFIYPITMSFIQRLYSTLRRTWTAIQPTYKESQKRAYYFLQATYFLQFLYATTLHIKVFGPRVFHLDQLIKLVHLETSIPPTNSANHELTKTAYQVVQWDEVFMFTSSLIATLAFARTKSEAIKIAVFVLIATITCGTGSAMACIWAWREQRLHFERVIRHEALKSK
jgi:p-aminobenzoyl-glutamate transporter AbgT